MDDLLADFIAETREMLEASEGELIAWEANPGDGARLDAIFRFVHTVKGNCGFFDFPRLEKLSHAAEDALAEVRAGRREPDSALVSAVLAIVDRIAQMVDAIEAGEDFPVGNDDALIAALEENADPLGELPAAEDSDQGTARSAQSSPATLRTIRLPVELLDRVMSGVSDMVLARNDLGHRLRQAGAQPEIDGPFERLATILNDVRDAVTRMRMQRIEHLYGALPRLVRDLSSELGKQVMIDLEGGDVELDREMIEMIRDPMTHIIRNAIDHGIEPPSDRLKAGKREIGLLSIAARQSGNKIIVLVSDDGRGLDVGKIAKKAISSGLITPQERDAMDPRDILQLIFEPGFSTAETVSSVSGRGVGLDVVRANVEKVGGSIDVQSEPGEGTLFFLQLPLTLSIISGLTMEVAGQRFALPQSYVEEIMRTAEGDADQAELGERSLVTFRGERVPVVSLARTLGLENGLERDERSLVMLRLTNGDLFALEVDRIVNIGDLVVKPLPPAVRTIGFYGGSTLQDDGTPFLLLDIPQIAEASGLIAHGRLQGQRRLKEQAQEAEKAHTRAMLFTDLEGRKRAVRFELVQRIERVEPSAIERCGDPARAVVDGHILPLVGLSDGEIENRTVSLLRLSDGSSELLYAVRKVEDAVSLENELVPAADEFVEAVTLVEGHSVALVDGHALFARYGVAPKAREAVTCRLPDSDWARTILVPLLGGAGYRIAEAEEPADIEIALDSETAVRAAAEGRTVVRLRDVPDHEASAAEREASVYRYDRESVLEALRRARKGEAA
jgi:two-component system chemotaxis sensor kinase CheA